MQDSIILRKLAKYMHSKMRQPLLNNLDGWGNIDYTHYRYCLEFAEKYKVNVKKLAETSLKIHDYNLSTDVKASLGDFFGGEIVSHFNEKNNKCVVFWKCRYSKDLIPLFKFKYDNKDADIQEYIQKYTQEHIKVTFIQDKVEELYKKYSNEKRSIALKNTYIYLSRVYVYSRMAKTGTY